MTPRGSFLLAVLIALAALPASANDDINLDPDCRLAARQVLPAISRQDPAGLNEIGKACFCKYGGGHASCSPKQENAAPAPGDAVSQCKANHDAYGKAESDIEDLVANRRGSTLYPPGGWAGGEYQNWIDGKKSIGLLNKSTLREQLEEIKKYLDLSKAYVGSCDQALKEANDSFKPKMLTLRALGGAQFETDWTGRRAGVERARPQLQSAAENLAGVLN